MPFYKKNGYDVGLPADDVFQKLAAAGTRPSEAESKELFTRFAAQDYREADYDAPLHALHGAETVIAKVIPTFTRFARRWGFRVSPRYDVILTLYGPGGSFDYDAERGYVHLFATTDAKFKTGRGLDSRPESGVETIVHEMVHIGVKEVVTERFKLEHWEEERVVDRICLLALKDVLPGYRMQRREHAMDPFITAGALDEIPSAVERYVASRGPTAP
jgi:hypothetical protein